ncbi:hypothetical protein ABPG72_007856 [Tetrahymena utriculariae]
MAAYQNINSIDLKVCKRKEQSKLHNQLKIKGRTNILQGIPSHVSYKQLLPEVYHKLSKMKINQLLLFEQSRIFSNQSLQQINQLDKKYMLNKKYIQKLKYIQIFKSGILKNSKYFELPYKRSSFSKQQSRQKTNKINTYMELNQFQNCHHKRYTF